MDYSGKKPRIVDSKTGEVIVVELFVAVLGASNYTYAEATLTQLRLYTEEYQRGAFAVSAPTDAVQVVGGREPEDFETIARRYAASRPEAVRTRANKLRALRNFIRILATAKPDPDRIERQLNHVLLEAPTFASESTEWRHYHQSGTEAAFGIPRQSLDDGVVPVRAIN